MSGPESGAARRGISTAHLPHRALIWTPLERVVATNVKSTGCPAFGTVKVVCHRVYRARRERRNM